MGSIGPSILILGLVIASATAQQGPTQEPQNGITTPADATIATTMAINTITKSMIDVTTFKTTTNNNTTNNTTTNNTTTNENDNNGTTTIKPSTAQSTSMAPMNSSPTPQGGKTNPTATYTMSPKSTTSTTKAPVPAITTPKSRKGSDDTVGIIIVVVMICAGIVLAAACYFTRKKARRYSVDLHSRPDDAHIPLSTVEPTDAVSQKGMKTFDSVETKELQGLVAKPEEQEEPKAEADKPIVEPSPDPAAVAPSSDSSVDKAKEEIVEQPPAKPVEPSPEEKTDDEGTVSNKTSVESLKEPNENNSNNASKALGHVQGGDIKNHLEPNNIFSEVPLDSPV